MNKVVRKEKVIINVEVVRSDRPMNTVRRAARTRAMQALMARLLAPR